MLKPEYDAMLQAQRERHDKRSWLFTIIFTLLAAVPVLGIFAVWRHVADDGTLFLTIILPLVGMTCMLGFIALIGRPRAILEALRNFPVFWLY